MTRIISFLFLSFLIACSDKTSKQTSAYGKDSIMAKYFKAIDSLPYFDTLNRDFKLLKSYHNGDTAVLRKAYEEVAEIMKYRNEMLESHICDDLPPLNTLNYEKAYRFSYGAAFCNKTANLTIGKLKDSITLELFIYELNDKQTECKTIQHTKRLVDTKLWDTLISGI